MVKPGYLSGPVEFGADRVLRQPPAVVGEQELGGPPVAGVGHRASVAADLGDVVDQFDDVVVDRDHPLGIELAERDLDPTAVARQFVQAVQLKVEQFPDAQSAGSLQT